MKTPLNPPGGLLIALLFLALQSCAGEYPYLLQQVYQFQGRMDSLGLRAIPTEVEPEVKKARMWLAQARESLDLEDEESMKEALRLLDLQLTLIDAMIQAHEARGVTEKARATASRVDTQLREARKATGEGQ